MLDTLVANSVRLGSGLLSVLLVAGVTFAQTTLPPPPVPKENPITEPKRLLGKMLFWDVQLSTDNTMACGTCHRSGSGGADPRDGAHPGLDGVFGTDDDVRGSRGVRRTDEGLAYAPDPLFGFDPRVTRRVANPLFTASYAPVNFWDGRADRTFVDPETGHARIETDGGLESQAVNPPLSDVEMAHEMRDWTNVKSKLASAIPLALATDLPPDVAAALDSEPSYGDLFQAAYGDDEINAERIAFAIATYERTLVPDDTPWDRFIAGDPEAMTTRQIAGWNAFQSAASRCDRCHVPPLFSDTSFRNIGLRPWPEDAGRMEVTKAFDDRAKFKVPSLRNVGLRQTLMHNGHLTTLAQVLDFYLEINGQQHFPENQDPLIPNIVMGGQTRLNVIEFLRNGLTDPRVAAATFPFDHPTLHTELAPNPALIGAGSPGSGGGVPRIIADATPNLGFTGFHMGVADALGGAEAFVTWSTRPPGPDGRLVPDELHGPIVLDGVGVGAGYGTWTFPIADDPEWRGRRVYVQWFVTDPAGENGLATSAVARLTFFREDPTECDCPGDLDCDGLIAFGDILRLLVRWGDCPDCREDVNADETVSVEDLLAVLAAWGPACPE